MQTLRFSATDGTPLVATLFKPAQKARSAVLIGAALGVNQRFYAAFALWLAQQGHMVMTFDLRGIGASLAPGQHLRNVQGNMLTWAQQDFSAAVRTLAEQSGQAQVTVIGHSLGAHHPAMTLPETQARIAKVLAVAAGSGYWRDWAPPSRRLAPLMLHLAVPLLTPLFGYFPGKRLSMVGDLPGGVMRQLTRWYRHPQFAWGADPDLLLPALTNARFPVHAISFTDDEAITLECTRKLLAALPNATSNLEVINPQAMGAQRIGHLGAFRKNHATVLWPHLEQRLA
jgi:predicted alpha/beta hydrolase